VRGPWLAHFAAKGILDAGVTAAERLRHTLASAGALESLDDVAALRAGPITADDLVAGPPLMLRGHHPADVVSLEAAASGIPPRLLIFVLIVVAALVLATRVDLDRDGVSVAGYAGLVSRTGRCTNCGPRTVMHTETRAPLCAHVAGFQRSRRHRRSILLTRHCPGRGAPRLALESLRETLERAFAPGGSRRRWRPEGHMS
jgi:hypothetical protein